MNDARSRRSCIHTGNLMRTYVSSRWTAKNTHTLTIVVLRSDQRHRVVSPASSENDRLRWSWGPPAGGTGHSRFLRLRSSRSWSTQKSPSFRRWRNISSLIMESPGMSHKLPSPVRLKNTPARLVYSLGIILKYWKHIKRI